jgi:O-antigen ligase
LLGFAAAFQGFVGILTFTRTFWIVSLVQIAYLLMTEWRQSFRRYANQILLAGILLVPFAVGILIYLGSYSAQSSNTTRWMMAEISWNFFKDNPVFGVGAGTFIDRIGQVWTFAIEFGAPLDSHGILQKIATETGLLGLAALAGVAVAIVLHIRRALPLIMSEQARRILHLLIAGALGAFVYQLFNTDYWTGKLWLPIGLMLAAVQVLAQDGPFWRDAPDEARSGSSGGSPRDILET